MPASRKALFLVISRGSDEVSALDALNVGLKHRTTEP